MEIFQIIQKYYISAIARCYCSSVLQVKAFCCVKCCHTDCCHRIKTFLHTNAQMIIEMSFMKNCLRLTVIRTEQASSTVLCCHSLDQCAKIVTCRTLTEKNVHSSFQTVIHLFYCRTFMICCDSCSGICIQFFPCDSWSMSINKFAFLFCYNDLIQITVCRIDHTREIHELTKSGNSFSCNRLFHSLCVDHRTCVLERCSRYARWKFILHIKHCILSCSHHIVKAGDSTYIYNLVRVCHNGCSSVWN